ncbi:hypothetical protein CVT25_010437 [Psilocybe cyanescens]|uniref:Uncharacterized protein n=1 Tax=Psilocybe cyanescens TaxID=93625 RepID=A0A409XDL6_PSICY|nr:hypothetical protein CVT25_010437 [Psilocybe cyanescens]
MIGMTDSTVMIVKKMPAPGLSKAPMWSGDLSKLLAFLMKFERLAKAAAMDNKAMVEAVVEYLKKNSDVKFWKTFKGY